MNRTPCFQALGLRPLRSSFFLLAVLLLFPALAARAGDGGAFVSQNVPTSMVAGQQYSVSVTMQNIGTTNWTDGSNYRLGFCHPQGNPQSTAVWSTPGNRVIQPLNVPPQGKVTFAFLVTAPAAAGTYNFQWQMLQENVAWIGTPSANVPITVTAPPGGQPTNPQIPRGSSTAFSGAGSDEGGNRVGSWVVSFPNGGYASSISNTNPPYSVHCNNGVLTVGVLSNATPGANYSVNYTTSSQGLQC